MKRIFGPLALVAVALVVLVGAAAAAPSGVTSNDFESNTAGWLGVDGSTITQRASSYVNPGGYASGIAAAGGSYFAGLNRGTCGTSNVNPAGTAVNCAGPYTDWGNLNNYHWNGPYTTQVDIYLDTDYANAHPDTFGGNLDLVSGSSDAAEYGTRFDFTSAINSSTPDGSGNAQHLRDFGFNVSTGYAGDSCNGFMITGQTVVNRINANPNIGQHDPVCIDQKGWYTFKHSFSSQNGFLDVLMQIFPKGSPTAVATWDITGIDADGTYGCNRYGWFSDQEIYGLPIDNASISGGCATSTATLSLTKFYDANANGTKDSGESDISGWKVKVSNGVDPDQVGTTPFSASTLAPGDWTASEFSPIETNWFATTPTSVPKILAAGDDESVSFGNVCTGAGGGLTIGFWTNKNGGALFGSSELALLTSLNLRNANGSDFDPTTYAQLKTWLSKATATNMAYMLSAQLAAMELNVDNGKVVGSALVYAPGTQSANDAGFATVNALMAEANTELGDHGLTLAGSPDRSYQETLKNALEQGNLNRSFAQATPCSFSFAS